MNQRFQTQAKVQIFNLLSNKLWCLTLGWSNFKTTQLSYKKCKKRNQSNIWRNGTSIIVIPLKEDLQLHQCIPGLSFPTCIIVNLLSLKNVSLHCFTIGLWVQTSTKRLCLLQVWIISSKNMKNLKDKVSMDKIWKLCNNSREFTNRTE